MVENLGARLEVVSSNPCEHAYLSGVSFFLDGVFSTGYPVPAAAAGTNRAWQPVLVVVFLAVIVSFRNYY